MCTKILVTSCLLLIAACGRAQDASLLAGRLKVNNSADHSFAVDLGYSYRLGDHAALSAEYLNEGHPPLHHRDGLSSQFWLRTRTPEQGPSFAAGFGPYYYFDTTTGSGSATDYRNEHGWGTLASVSAKWHLEKRSYIELRANRVAIGGQHGTTMVMLGLGYELRNLPPDVTHRNAEAGDRLVMLYAGQTILNSFASERAAAAALEHRRTITDNAEWSAMLLSEGRGGPVERKGVAAQLWLLRPFTERTVLQMGTGPYLMHDQVRGADAVEDARTHLVPIASIGMRYRISDRWRAQLTWNRVITGYHRDSDLLMVGGGAAF
jgi:hypothetical protein